MGMIMLVTALGMVWHTCRKTIPQTGNQRCTHLQANLYITEPSLLYTMSAGWGGNTCRQTIHHT